MKKLRLYLDTSVLGGIFDTEDPKKVDMAKNLLNLIKDRRHYEGYISFLTMEEVLKAPAEIQNELKNKISEANLKILEETEGHF